MKGVCGAWFSIINDMVSYKVEILISARVKGFRCGIFTIPIAAQVPSLRPAALGFHLIVYIITGLLTPKAVGSD